MICWWVFVQTQKRCFVSFCSLIFFFWLLPWKLEQNKTKKDTETSSTRCRAKRGAHQSQASLVCQTRSVETRVDSRRLDSREQTCASWNNSTHYCTSNVVAVVVSSVSIPWKRVIDARTLFFSTRDTVGKFVCVGFSLDSFLVIFFSLKKKKKTMLT